MKLPFSRVPHMFTEFDRLIKCEQCGCQFSGSGRAYEAHIRWCRFAAAKVEKPLVESFFPSNVALQLLFPGKVLFCLSRPVSDTIFDSARKSISLAFARAVAAVRDWACITSIPDPRVIIVSRTGQINADFVQEINLKADLMPLASFNNYDFQVRFGEEVLIWAIKQGDTLSSCGLAIDEHGNLISVRTEKKLII